MHYIRKEAQPPKLPPANYQPLYHTHAQIPQIPPQPEPDFLRPVSDPRSPGRTQYEPVLPMQNYLGMPNNWGMPGPRQPQAMQSVPQIQQYQDNMNRGYVHKDSAPHAEGPLSQIQYPEYAGRVGNYYGDNYRQPIQQENWPGDEVRYPPQQPNYHQENPVPIVPAKTEGTSHIVEQETVQQNEPISKPSETAVNSKHVQEKLAHDLKHSKDNMDHGSTQKVVLAKLKKPSHQDQYQDVVAYKLTDDTQDGLSHIPRGAILSLTLGLIITGVMAILIGCRLRVVRRRLRKGGKGYAHDADYLVNGMYL